jgi:hypothetical protein
MTSVTCVASGEEGANRAIALGHDPGQPIRVDHQDRSNAVLLHQFERLFDGVGGRDADDALCLLGEAVFDGAHCGPVSRRLI